jgi:hypothetical protein
MYLSQSHSALSSTKIVLPPIHNKCQSFSLIYSKFELKPRHLFWIRGEFTKLQPSSPFSEEFAALPPFTIKFLLLLNSILLPCPKQNGTERNKVCCREDIRRATTTGLVAAAGRQLLSVAEILTTKSSKAKQSAAAPTSLLVRITT